MRAYITSAKATIMAQLRTADSIGVGVVVTFEIDLTPNLMSLDSLPIRTPTSDQPSLVKNGCVVRIITPPSEADLRQQDLDLAAMVH